MAESAQQAPAAAAPAQPAKAAEIGSLHRSVLVVDILFFSKLDIFGRIAVFLTFRVTFH
jgi:hypothetical protein